MNRRPRAEVAHPFFSPAAPRVFAHRGLAIDAPENTLLAFRNALEAGALYLETDVHATADGVAVIAHDADLLRVAGHPGRVEELSFAELRRLDLGHGQTFPSLAEALAAFPTARFNIDVKAEAAARPCAQAIIAAGAQQRVLIASFAARRRRAALRLLPDAATSASQGATVAALAACRLGLTAVARRMLSHVQAVQVPPRYQGVPIVTGTMVGRLHAAGVEVHVWTINDAATMAELLEIGVDGIVTDRADVAIQLLKEH